MTLRGFLSLLIKMTDLILSHLFNKQEKVTVKLETSFKKKVWEIPSCLVYSPSCACICEKQETCQFLVQTWNPGELLPPRWPFYIKEMQSYMQTEYLGSLMSSSQYWNYSSSMDFILEAGLWIIFLKKAYLLCKCPVQLRDSIFENTFLKLQKQCIIRLQKES